MRRDGKEEPGARIQNPGGASRGACLACEAVVSKGLGCGHRCQLAALLCVCVNKLVLPIERRPKGGVYLGFSPAHHGLASEARSTAAPPPGFWLLAPLLVLLQLLELLVLLL